MTQFDLLQHDEVIWRPYIPDRVYARYPGGISPLCVDHQRYWLTRSKIIFDVSVEEMSQHRVMRQFGMAQSADIPTSDRLPQHIHK